MKFFQVGYWVLIIFATQWVCPSHAQESIDPGISYIRGKEHLLKGEFKQALPFLKEAHQADPESSIVNSQLAETYLRLNDIENAQKYAKRSVELEPSNIEYRTTLAGIFAATKNYAEAKAEYKKILELDPENAKAPLLVGIIEAESGDLSEGIKSLSQVIDKKPENVMALFYRARMYLEQENLNLAKADLNQALSLRPSFVEAGTALGMIYEKSNQSEEAIKAYSRIQGNGPFRKRLAELYLRAGNTNQALVELQIYTKAEPDDYTARIQLGLIHFEKKELAQAKEVFESVLKEEPDSDSVRFYYAWVLEDSGKLKEAVREFKKIKNDSNLHKEATLHIGYLYKKEGNNKEGLKYSKKLFKNNQQVEEYYDLYATFLEANKKVDEALQVVVKGVNKFPKNEKLLYLKGVFQEKAGDKKAAIQSMKELITVNAQNYHALNFVGYLYAELGENLEEAEGYIRKAMALKPSDGFIEDSLGWVLFKQGKLEESQKALERAAALEPEEAIIVEHLGDVYQAQKKFAEASAFYKKAAELASGKDQEQVKSIKKKLAGLPKKTDTASEAPDSRVPSAQ